MSSVENIIKLAFLYSIKVAMHQNLCAKDLDFLDADEKGYVEKMGKDMDSPMNPPPFVADKKVWQKAKKVTKKYWKKYDEPYAVVLDVYKNMGGKIKKKKKGKKKS